MEWAELSSIMIDDDDGRFSRSSKIKNIHYWFSINHLVGWGWVAVLPRPTNHSLCVCVFRTYMWWGWDRQIIKWLGACLSLSFILSSAKKTKEKKFLEVYSDCAAYGRVRVQFDPTDEGLFSNLPRSVELFSDRDTRSRKNKEVLVGGHWESGSSREKGREGHCGHVS